MSAADPKKPEEPASPESFWKVPPRILRYRDPVDGSFFYRYERHPRTQHGGVRVEEGDADYADALKLVRTYGSLDGPDTPWLRRQIQAQREQEREKQAREQQDIERQIREEQERKVREEQRKEQEAELRSERTRRYVLAREREVAERKAREAANPRLRRAGESWLAWCWRMRH
jgi:hypothetical protein